MVNEFMKNFIALCGLIFCLFNNLFSQQIIKVGGYVFPPFIEKEGEAFVGVTIDLLDTLNTYQDEYFFQFVPTSSKRRYVDFDNQKFDVLF